MFGLEGWVNNMKTKQIYGIVFSLMLVLTLHLSTLDNIYFGVYDNDRKEWTEINYIVPDSLEYELDLEQYLKPNHNIYFFYNLGFGHYNKEGRT